MILRTTDDRIVVHRRADWKDVYPGSWDLCFGGVLDAGEAWDHAARRELAEEAGVEAEVRELGRGHFEDDRTRVVGRIYEAAHDGPYPCPDGEVVEVRTIAIDHLPEFVTNHVRRLGRTRAPVPALTTPTTKCETPRGRPGRAGPGLCLDARR